VYQNFGNSSGEWGYILEADFDESRGKWGHRANPFHWEGGGVWIFSGTTRCYNYLIY